MLKKYLKKVLSVFVLLLSLLGIFFINYYIVLDARYKAMGDEVDVQAVQKYAEQLDGLYGRLDGLEIAMRKKNAPFEETAKFREYNEVKRSVEELRNKIDRSLNIGEATLSSKALSLLNFRNGALGILQVILVVWVVFVFKGIFKTVKSNKRIDEVSKTIFNFDKRDEIESYRAAYEAIKDHEKKVAANRQQEREFSQQEFVEADNSSGGRGSVEVEQEDFRDAAKQDFSWEQLDSNEYEEEDRKEQILRDKLDSKKWEQRLKKVMDNPRVKLIVDYYKQGMDVKDIAETTGLSRDEVEFVVKMWETVIKR